ncbi:MAG: Hpt domain-containing protein [Anaerolineae bacterium]|jgi:HPt (histidine-containing phosphotransfer) domain-containing protein
MPTDEILDQATFAGLLDSLGGDIDFLSELVEAYLDSSPGLLASMQEALASGEAPTLQRAAHSLKTGSASFGAVAFAAQCKELEELAKTGALAGAEEKLGAIEAAYTEVAAALQARLP